MSNNDNQFRDVTKKVGFTAFMAVVGAVISRWHGGGFVGGSPKMLKNFLWALPFGVISFAAYFHDNLLKAITIGVISLAVCMLGKTTGHGGGMDLGHNPKEAGDGREPEKVEYLILWIRKAFHVKRSYWYDALLLALVGLFAVAGAAIAVGWTNPLAGIIIALGGVLKAPAYMIGWAIFPDGQGDGPKDLDEATAIGEFLTGFFAFLALAIAIWVGL